MKLLIMSDIHGNANALAAVLNDIGKRNIEACILLGDIIDYGMHSNEVIESIKQLKFPIICNIWGNHEDAVMRDEYTRFSSDRGRECARYTKSQLTEESIAYIKSMHGEGRIEFTVEGKKFLAVHGSLKDYFWKSIDVGDDLTKYEKYDVVLSGHSHLPHFFEKYYKCDNPLKRNKNKVIFINPGSVGQPRNLNPLAQYVIFDTKTEEIEMRKVTYDIAGEQRAFRGQVDDFYKSRLKEGV